MKRILAFISIFTVSLAFGQNDPFIAAADIPAVPPMCLSQNAQIYGELGITDIDGDSVYIISVQSNNNSVLPGTNVGYSYLEHVGNVNYFYVAGTALAAGNVVLTLEVSDGDDTVMLTLPSFTVSLVTEPAFTTSLVSLCSNQGMVDLNNFINVQGGQFYSNSYEFYFDNGLYDTGNGIFPLESTEELSYELNIGTCYFNLQADIIIHSSPTVSVSRTSTACAQSTGTATATITGGAAPYGMSQWSSGQQNTTSVSGLAAGQYAFTITDANACKVNNYFEIATSGTSVTAAVQNVACYAGNTGAISLAPSGMMAPISVLWSSGHSTLNVSGLSAGNYTVQLTDAAGCILTKTYALTQPEPLSAQISTSQPDCGTTNGSLEAYDATGGIAPYTYAWSNGATGITAPNIGWGVYSLTTTDANGCMAITTAYVSEYDGAGLSGSITGANCGTPEGAIDVQPYLPMGESVVSINWSNGATTEDIENLLPALYICTLVTSNSCTSVKGWNIPIVKPMRNEICVVTVDDSTTTNLVVWERVQTEGIAYYNIYRETSIQGFFALIDTVQAANISLFNDVVASPLSRSWRYKISAVNGCGVESPLSNPHQTIHLDVLDNSGTSVTVNWNAYEGAAFSNYIVSRYTDAAGWEEVATVPASQLTYTDATPFSTPGLDYVVEVTLDEFCTAQIYRAQDFNSSRSNKDKGAFRPGNGTGDSNNGIDEAYLSAISIHPNPTTGLLTIAQESAENLTIEIRSVDGQLIRTLTTSQPEETVNIEALSGGIYFVTVGRNTARQTTRIIKY